MISDDEILNVIAGPIEAPASWRYQFGINSIFGCRAVAMLESDAKGSAAYLWVLAAATPNGVDFEENPSLVSSDSFDMQLVCEVPESLSNHGNIGALLGSVKLKSRLFSIVMASIC